MAIQIHANTDVGAPDLTSVPDRKQLFAIIYAVLVSGYGSHPGYGWQIIYDDSSYSTGNDGRLIIKHPDHEIYYVVDDNGFGKSIIGMAHIADSSGNVTGYQSGKINQAGSAQGQNISSGTNLENWKAFYDDVSNTLVFLGGRERYLRIGFNGFDDNLFSFYMGTLATVTELHPFPFFGVGQTGQENSGDSSNFLRFYNYSYTTIKKADGSNADGRQELRLSQSYSNENSKNPLNSSPVALITPMAMFVDDQPVGFLRGLAKPNEYDCQTGNQAIFSAYCQTYDENENGGTLKYPIIIGDETFYQIKKERESMVLVSTDPSRWADL